MAYVRWRFYDPLTTVEWTLPVNPSKSNTPVAQKNFTHESTAAPDGQTLIFEGLDSPAELVFSGVTHSQEHLETFVAWYAKAYQFRITDDLGRQFWVIFKKFGPPQREPKHDLPYRHTYDAACIVVGVGA